MVSKAFQILSDADKRAAYDRHGSDPDSRFAGMSTSGFGGGGGAPTFEGELSPEDLFNMFFGGGGFGGGGFGEVELLPLYAPDVGVFHTLDRFPDDD